MTMFYEESVDGTDEFTHSWVMYSNGLVVFEDASLNYSAEMKHYGIKRKSGRYPWGSGEDPYSRSVGFQQYIQSLKDAGITEEADIAKLIGEQAPDDRGFTVIDLRSTTTIAKEVQVYEEQFRAKQLKAKGLSDKAISEEMGLTPATVRNRLAWSEETAKSSLSNTADVLRKNVDDYEIVDIGKGVDVQMGLSGPRLRAAIGVLHDEGYQTMNLQVPNPGTRHKINQKVLVKPGTTFKEAMGMVDRLHVIGEHSENNGQSFLGIHPPVSIHPGRVKVKFAEEGGTLEDGAIYIKAGVKDLGMGKNNYVQARIQVGEGHYLKGLAILRHDMPANGPDIIFNTNKSKDVGKLGAMKELKKNPDGTVDLDNPFGSSIRRQITEVDPKTGKERAKSAINIVNEEGDWDTWRKSVPSQFLAKQPHSLIRSQLEVTRDQVSKRLAEIDKVTNPVIRKKMYEDFAEQIDADAVDLRAAAMPRQRTQVIVPMPFLSKNEVYAPQFEHGEPVILVRYPHGGRFEIPEVTVNNNGRKAKALLANATDAIGIHPSVAEKLSGADFDGDTVVVIPNRSGKVKGSASNASAQKKFDDGLKDYDPKLLYGGYKVIGKDKKGNDIGNFQLMKNTGKEMGVITNLITDMQVQGASPEHVVRAVKHSMVVIDAEKHKLDYKKSAEVNNIRQLIELYQTTPEKAKPGGATTLLSRATATTQVPDLQPRPAAKGGSVDPVTGARIMTPSGKTSAVFDKKTGTYTGEKVEKLTSYKRLALTDDAYTLVRDPNDPVERLYADHANAMKATANQVRLAALNTDIPRANPTAKKVYAQEVAELDHVLKKAFAQKPLERKAMAYARVHIKEKRKEDPSLRYDRDRMQKIEKQARAAAFDRLGLERSKITLTDRQWDAIQSGAITPKRLRDLLDYVDPKQINTLAQPRENTVMTSGVASRAKAMLAAGRTTADVARLLGIPPSTLRGALARGEV